MSDPNMADFYGRIARIEKARSKGYGFEAIGSLGRSYYYRPARKRRSVLAPILMVAVASIGLKGVIHAKVGAGIYEQRVSAMMNGQEFERLGGYLMTADPVTLFVSDKVSHLDL